MRSGKCPKCKGFRVGQLEARWNEGAEGQFVPLFLGVDAETWKAMGVLEAYVCAECGYLETYVRTPEKIPFDALEGFRWLNEEPQREGPFR